MRLPNLMLQNAVNKINSSLAASKSICHLHILSAEVPLSENDTAATGKKQTAHRRVHNFVFNKPLPFVSWYT
ncbi:hypothetical protein L1887_19108 [Cichorium endivia]|nr:hypothetical protein L1887_19108 [Cichorium endivia]